MAIMRRVERGRKWIGKLKHGADLLEELSSICRDAGIRLGRVEAIGAVQTARLAYYNQQEQAYEFFALDEPLEIISLLGNISLKDGQPMVHAHVTLANRNGQTFGGHLAPGTILFAGECMVEELLGEALVRGHDETTGLPLWTM